MRCERARELLDLTVGGTVPAADVGLDESVTVALDGHLTDCAPCRAQRDLLRETASGLERALAPEPWEAEADRALAARALAAWASTRLDDPVPRPRRRLLIITGVAAAACLAVAVSLGPLSEDAYPLAPPTVDGYRGPRFRDVARESGIRYRDHTGRAEVKDWMVEIVGHGAAVFDMDGDGDLDLFLPDGNRLDPQERVTETWRLYRNDGDMRFTDVTEGSGLDREDWAGGAVAGDLDADGRPDLFVTCYGENRLFLNRGGGRFEEVGVAAGVAGLPEEWSTAAALGDLDGDGDLDLFVTNYADMGRFIDATGKGRTCTWRQLAVACGPTPLEPQLDRLYLNRGDGTFEDATDARLPLLRRYSFQPLIADLNGDGALDVFVASDNHPNLLLLNDGTGHFTDQALAAGVSADADGNEQACMGVTAGDYDGDGALDLFITNFSHESCVIYRSVGPVGGPPQFADVTHYAGIRQPSYLTLGWGTSFLDYDLDGDLDLVAANGHLYPDIRFKDQGTTYGQHVSLYRNEGDGRYVEVSSSAGGDVVRPRAHRGLVVADFDDDGFPDVFVTVLNGAPVLLHNDGRGGGNWVRFVLRRADGRTEAPGARVHVRVGDSDRTIVREMVLGSSFASSEDPRVLVGLGRYDRAGSVEVTWPGGVRESFGGRQAGGTYELVEGSGVAREGR